MAEKIEWQIVGLDYPTVTLLYKNGSMISYPFSGNTIYVQSEDITNERLIGDIHWHLEFGAIFVLGIIAPIDTVVIALYKHFNPQESKQ